MMRAKEQSEQTIAAGAEGDALSHWVKLAFIAMRRELEASVRKAGLTVTQWKALGALEHWPGATHSDLVKYLEVEAPSVTSLVNGMERKGWVKRERSDSDARVKRLHLTLRGRRLLEEARSACAPVEQRVEEALPPRERSDLKRLLRDLIQRIH